MSHEEPEAQEEKAEGGGVTRSRRRSQKVERCARRNQTDDAGEGIARVGI